MTAKKLAWLVSVLALSVTTVARGQTLPIVTDVEPQPFIAQTMRLIEALEFLGSALPEADARRLEQLRDEAPTPRSTGTPELFRRGRRRDSRRCCSYVSNGRSRLMDFAVEERVEAEADLRSRALTLYDEIIRTSSVTVAVAGA